MNIFICWSEVIRVYRLFLFIDDLLDEDYLADTILYTGEINVDIIDIEMRNTSIQRSMKKYMQQTVAVLADVNVAWIL